MRASLAICAVVMSGCALACPDLAGTYVCREGKGETLDLTIQQASSNGVTAYLLNGGKVIADGKLRDEPDLLPMKAAQSRYSCHTDEKAAYLLYEQLGEYHHKGMVGRLIVWQRYQREPKSRNITRSVVMSGFVLGEPIQTKEKMTCKPKT